ncbi:predicted protein [Nematostella vectensis]|uniref:TTI1 C-terminal TPR domain-containing protein n=1 Tax=Nematostella vectensis TaxID=45351 RepID=A7T6X4_NEMVE|nr:predicted protein [Nematostella vectensis]|eukprot:XP_001620380.1 hypothetical protein NEMVEDRAFT_v1g223176 [Nematostella vectensis]
MTSSQGLSKGEWVVVVVVVVWGGDGVALGDSSIRKDRNCTTGSGSWEPRNAYVKRYFLELKVLDKCVHIVSSRSLVVCLLVLDTIDESVRFIRHHENHLLPLIHKLWPPLVRRLKHQEEVVVVKAIEVVCGMAECSGDFMRRRVEKDVLPWLLQYLERQAAVSAKVSGPAYLHTKALKLQLAALHGLRRLCSQVEVGGTELDRVCNTCTLYHL